jgi:hypothetical protein
VVSTPAPYSGGSEFGSQLGNAYTDWGYSFSQSLQANPGAVLKLGHDFFLPLSNSLFVNYRHSTPVYGVVKRIHKRRPLFLNVDFSPTILTCEVRLRCERLLLLECVLSRIVLAVRRVAKEVCVVVSREICDSLLRLLNKHCDFSSLASRPFLI